MKTYIVFLLFQLSAFLSYCQNSGNEKVISNDLKLIKLSENAYLHVSYTDSPKYGRFSSNGLIFIDEGNAFLFDTPTSDSLTKELVQWLKDSLKVKIAGFIPNHWHDDCMGGLGYLQSIGVNSYANEMTIEIARSKNLPLPDFGFKDSLVIDLGDKTINCYYLGAGHSLDNIVVWIPSEKILFAGCMVKELKSKTLGNTIDGDINEWPETIEKLKNKFQNADIVIPGHGAIGSIELIEHTRELLND